MKLQGRRAVDRFRNILAAGHPPRFFAAINGARRGSAGKGGLMEWARICYRANGEGLPRLVTVAFLARPWRRVGYLSRAVLVTLVAGLPAINAGGVYSQLPQHTLATG